MPSSGQFSEEPTTRPSLHVHAAFSSLNGAFALQSRGLRQKVVALRKTPSLACRRPVVPDGALALHKEQTPGYAVSLRRSLAALLTLGKQAGFVLRENLKVNL